MYIILLAILVLIIIALYFNHKRAIQLLRLDVKFLNRKDKRKDLLINKMNLSISALQKNQDTFKEALKEIFLYNDIDASILDFIDTQNLKDKLDKSSTDA